MPAVDVSYQQHLLHHWGEELEEIHCLEQHAFAQLSTFEIERHEIHLQPADQEIVYPVLQTISANTGHFIQKTFHTSLFEQVLDCSHNS